jgi:hypothetical protein
MRIEHCRHGRHISQQLSPVFDGAGGFNAVSSFMLRADIHWPICNQVEGFSLRMTASAGSSSNTCVSRYSTRWPCWIPTFIGITDGTVHDINILDEILPEAGAF